MRYGIGIDTGGTYTDAVIYDFDERKTLDSAKALTTKDDLSEGILKALDQLDAPLCEKAAIVSLSTTLATNACVEGKGGRAKLLFIGVDPRIVEWVGADSGLTDPDRIVYLHAKTSIDGTIAELPDWDSFWAERAKWLEDADALAIVELHAASNAAVLEKEAQAKIQVRTGIPVICGHELFHDLNSIKRGASVLLNGRLIPVLAEFLGAIRAALQKRRIFAPVAIVRSDGSLMSERFTGARPVETILCGPAASVIGADALLRERNALIVDMGGTTTDIALIRNGIPLRAGNGVEIGAWRTFVKGLAVRTLGLGGDSAVRYDKHGRFYLDTARVIPLCVAATRWPEITPQLRELFASKEKHTKLLHEFFVLIKPIEGNRFYTDEEQRFCAGLAKGPLSYSQAAAAVGKDVYSLTVERLEREGIVTRCGLTPTDIMHLRGDFTGFAAEASDLGARFVANSMEMSPEKLCALVYDCVKRKLYSGIARLLLEENMPEFFKNGTDTGLEALLHRAWDMANGMRNEHLCLLLETKSVLVGVGAPIHIFLPDVARALRCEYKIPDLASVVNAIGAVAGNVMASCEITISPKEDGYLIAGPTITERSEDLDEASAIASEAARREARAEALRRGAAEDIAVDTQISPVIIKTGYGSQVHVRTVVTATAIGRILS